MKNKIFLFIIVFSITGCITKKNVDLIIHNAHIFPLTEEGKEFEAMAINDGIIIDIGKEISRAILLGKEFSVQIF